MNQDWSEKILDSMLEEVITGCHPPDLTARIDAAWRAEKLAHPDRLILATAIASPALQGREYVKPLATAYSTAPRPSVGPRRRRRPWVAPVMAVAASVLLLATCVHIWQRSLHDGTSWQLAPSVVSSDPSADEGPASLTPDRQQPPKAAVLAGNDSPSGAAELKLDHSPSANNSSLALDGPPSVAQPVDLSVAQPVDLTAKKEPSYKSATGDTLAIDNLPVATTNSPSIFNSGGTSREGVSARSARLVTRMEDAQIVELIDSQLATLWQQLGIVPTAPMTARDYVANSFTRLLGRQASASEVAERLNNGNLPDPAAFVESLVRAPGFAQHWSDFTARRLVGNTPAVASPEGKVFRDMLAKNVNARTPWNTVLSRLVATVDEGEASPADDFFMSSLAGNKNHLLASRIGSAMLDQNVGCARCHDARTAIPGETVTQERFWSLVAVLSGIDSQAQSKGAPRRLIDRQLELVHKNEPTVFFELPDGRLRGAEQTLPDGTSWNAASGVKTPREALAQWLVNSPELDRAIANHAWRFVFGRPLVPGYGALDEVGLKERSELLAFLAGQLRVHSHDVGKLVSWLAQSRAFTLQPNPIDRQKWLLASAAERASWKNAEFTFAAGGVLGKSPESKTLETSLIAAAKWSSLEQSGKQRTLMAQPNSLTQPKSKAKTKPPVIDPSTIPSLSYVMYGLNDGPNSYIDRLLSSKLGWKDQVLHVVGLAGDYTGSKTIEQLAERILKESDGNRREALIKLLWAVQNSDT